MDKLVWVQVDQYKQVEVYGQMVSVPIEAKYAAIDKDGTVYAFNGNPVLGHRYWDPNGDGYCTLGTVELGDTDWKTTLQGI